MNVMKANYPAGFACCIAIFLLMFSSAYSSGMMLLADHAALNGYVKDESNGETLIGATVVIKDTKFGSYTNRQGFYNINNVPAGQYTIKVSMVGYETREMKVTLDKNLVKRLDIQIKAGSVISEGIGYFGKSIPPISVKVYHPFR